MERASLALAVNTWYVSGLGLERCNDSDPGATFGRVVACYGVWPRDRNPATVPLSNAPPLGVLQVQTDVRMKHFINMSSGDRTQPNSDATYRTYGTASIDYILPCFPSLLGHNTITKLKFYGYQSLHTTARNELHRVPILPLSIAPRIAMFHRSSSTSTTQSPPTASSTSPTSLSSSNSFTSLSPSSLAGRNFASIYLCYAVMRCSPMARVFDLFIIVYIGVIALGCAP